MMSRLNARAWLLGLLACATWFDVRADQWSCASAALPLIAAAPALPLLRSELASDKNELVTWSIAPDGTVTGTAERVELTKDVTVHFGQREIQADKVTYDRQQNTLRAVGQVRFSDPLVRMQGDTGYYSDDGAQFTNAQFQFIKQPGRGSARSIDMSPTRVITLKDVTYTTCPQGQNDWLIRARDLTLDTQAQHAVGHGAQVDFKGVPIMYVPWISFPLSDTRESGFLVPNFSTSSRSGVILSTPWYWNIAPNQDLTFTPTLYSRRGIDSGVEYRFLGESNRATIDGNFLPDDRQTDSDRSYLHVTDRLELADNWRASVDAQNASDTEYLEDFAEGSQATSIPFLPQTALLGHRDDVWQLGAEVVHFQTLDDALPLTDRPYLQLPRLDADALWHLPAVPGLEAGFDSELVDFWRDVGVTGWRLDARPELALDWTRPGYFFRPSAAWEFTQYSLDNTDGGRSPSRNLPIVTVDSGLQFERDPGPDGTHSYTLEPRVMYVYIPYRSQSDLPIFDTAPPDLNLIELFRPNRYVGIDRIGDANAVTAGLTTEMFDSVSGARYLSASIGQVFYLQTPRVTLPTELPDTSLTSSLISEIDLTALKNWNVQLNIASDNAVAHIEKAEISLQYRPNGTQVANLSYRFLEGELQQTDASFAWPISRHWDAYARSVYSILDHASIENFAGFQFHGDCWGIRVIARRSVSSRSGERDTSYFMELELKGLSNVGTGDDAFLEQSIQGYSPITNR